MTTGKHLINGQWINGPSKHVSNAHSGQGFEIQNANSDMVNQAVNTASRAFKTYGQSTSEQRANLLRAIATEINLRGTAISETCGKETGLPPQRLSGERGRTTQQLEMFANYIEDGSYLQRSIDNALPERTPIPRPELRKMMRPYGPVAVFGASNFPLAFSTAGGDTASALAAGCPVVVKGHPAHPATSELMAEAILAALLKCDMDPGVFSLIQDSGIEVAQSLVTHPGIQAVGFTGSLQAGRTMFDLCNQRPVPIPFYGEMGSLNPVFILPNALKQSASEIASGWVESLNLATGQFCTKPGLLIVPNGKQGDDLVQLAKQHLQDINANTMLTSGIATNYIEGVKRIQQTDGVEPLFCKASEIKTVGPNVFETSTDNWLNTESLHDEVFGPFALIVRTHDDQDLLAVAKHLSGQLTATLFIENNDHELANDLIQILEQKAGRILANGYPTGVEVAESMVHGGPYPASTFMGTTSVGTTAIQRFLKPVCFQNIPIELLPEELRAI